MTGPSHLVDFKPRSPTLKPLNPTGSQCQTRGQSRGAEHRRHLQQKGSQVDRDVKTLGGQDKAVSCFMVIVLIGGGLSPA